MGLEILIYIGLVGFPLLLAATFTLAQRLKNRRTPKLNIPYSQPDSSGWQPTREQAQNALYNFRETRNGNRMNINNKQKTVLIGGLILIVISILFPPFARFSLSHNSIEYSFLFTSLGKIEFTRLFLEWVLIAVVTGIFYLFTRKNN